MERDTFLADIVMTIREVEKIKLSLLSLKRAQDSSIRIMLERSILSSAELCFNAFVNLMDIENPTQGQANILADGYSIKVNSAANEMIIENAYLNFNPHVSLPKSSIDDLLGDVLLMEKVLGIILKLIKIKDEIEPNNQEEHYTFINNTLLLCLNPIINLLSINTGQSFRANAGLYGYSYHIGSIGSSATGILRSPLPKAADK